MSTPRSGSGSRVHAREGARQIRDFIARGAADGAFRPGEKLPTERELVRRFALPRNVVRKALAQLEAQGAITRHVGRGTFLAPADDEGSRAFTAADAAGISPAELMEARLRIEPALAELIATHATEPDFARLERCLERGDQAATLDDWELWDAALHQSLAAATHNRFVMRVMDMVGAVRSQSEWGRLKDRIVTPERRLAYQDEHRRIVAALRDRDVGQARAAILEHLLHAQRNLFGY